jgi:nucleotide-binding universal stress UspA family protein
MPSGPVLISYDGSPAAERAVRESGELLAPKKALVVVVWKQGLAFEVAELPTSTIGLPPAPLDLRAALEFDRRLLEGAQRRAEQGARLAREAGFEAEGLAVADDPDVPIPETLAQVARERDAAAMVVGSHDHNGLLGPISRDVVRLAPCPVVVVRGPAPRA